MCKNFDDIKADISVEHCLDQAEDRSLPSTDLLTGSEKTDQTDQVRSPLSMTSRSTLDLEKHQELEQVRNPKVISSALLAATARRKGLDALRTPSAVGTALAATEKVVREWTKARAAAKAKVLPQAALLAAFSTWAGWVSGR